MGTKLEGRQNYEVCMRPVWGMRILAVRDAFAEGWIANEIYQVLKQSKND